MADLWHAAAGRLVLREQGVEFLSVLLLSCAAMASAWFAYRSSWWSSEQSRFTLTMSRSQERAAVLENTAVQVMAFDGGMFIQYSEALLDGDQQVMGFLRQRFRPEMLTALDAWEATQPLTNPGAPSSPFVMDGYVVPQGVEAAQLRSQAQQAEENARESDRRSTQFVTFTVMAASSLFLGGISSKFPHHRWKVGLLAVAWVVLLGTITFLVVYSISIEPLPGLTPLPD